MHVTTVSTGRDRANDRLTTTSPKRWECVAMRFRSTARTIIEKNTANRFQPIIEVVNLDASLDMIEVAFSCPCRERTKDGIIGIIITSHGLTEGILEFIGIHEVVRRHHNISE